MNGSDSSKLTFGLINKNVSAAVLLAKSARSLRTRHFISPRFTKNFRLIVHKTHLHYFSNKI